jgi:hypothetical protein
MSATARRGQRALAPLIPAAADFRARVKEAAIAVESALVAAEGLASHGVVESLNFERMVDLLEEAAIAVDMIDIGMPSAPITIFPTRSYALSFIGQHPLDDDHLYQIRQDGAGRCTIAVFRLIAHL